MLAALLQLIQLLIELLRPPRDVVKRVKGIHELDHGLRVLLELGRIALDEEGQRQVVEDILIKFIFGVGLKILEKPMLLGDAAVKLEVVDELLLARVHIGLDLFAVMLELDAVAGRLPAEVIVRVAARRLDPEVRAFRHGLLNQSRIVACLTEIAKLVGVQRRRLLHCLRPRLGLSVVVASA